MTDTFSMIPLNSDNDQILESGIEYKSCDQSGDIFELCPSGFPSCPIIISLAPLPVASFTADVYSGSPPLTVSFTDTSSGSPHEWEWVFDDGDTSTEQNPTHTFTSGGTFSVSLTVTNYGDSDTAVESIVVSSVCSCDDTFTGTDNDPIDTAIWSYTNSPYIYDNKCRQDHNFSYYQLDNNCTFSGDFDVCVDVYPVDVDVSYAYCHKGLMLTTEGEYSWYSFWIYLRVYNSTSASVRTQNRATNLVADTTLTAVPEFIQFRIERVGTLVTAYYRLDSADSWIEHGTEDSTGDVFDQIALPTEHYGYGYVTDYDNFTVMDGCPT